MKRHPVFILRSGLLGAILAASLLGSRTYARMASHAGSALRSASGKASLGEVWPSRFFSDGPFAVLDVADTHCRFFSVSGPAAALPLVNVAPNDPRFQPCQDHFAVKWSGTPTAAQWQTLNDTLTRMEQNPGVTAAQVLVALQDAVASASG